MLARSLRLWVGYTGLGFVIAAVPVRSADAQLDGIIRNLMQAVQPPAYQPPPPAPYPAPERPYYRPPAPAEPYPRAAIQPSAPGQPGAGTGVSASSGKYCIDRNTTMLLVRRRGQNLEFAISAWSGRGHLFSVAGIGVPEVGGWTFQAGPNTPDVQGPCQIQLHSLADGGYEFWTSPGASCSEGQGWSYQPGQRVKFPAQSRRGGIAANKTMAEAASMERSGERCP